MTTSRTQPAQTRPPAAAAVGWLAILGVVGATFMSLAHTGLDLGFSGGGRAILPVAVGMAVGAVLYALVAFGAFTSRSWAWPAALLVNAIALAATLFPFRWPSGLVPLAISLAAIGILVSRPGRAAFLRED